MCQPSIWPLLLKHILKGFGASLIHSITVVTSWGYGWPLPAHSEENLSFLLLYHYSQSLQKHFQIIHKISCQETIMAFIKSIKTKKLNYRRIFWFKKLSEDTCVSRLHWKPGPLPFTSYHSGENMTFSYNNIPVGMMNLSVMDQLRFHSLKSYAFVSFVQLFSAKWLNHIVHVIQEEKN